jgi:hypothetical protein
MTNSSIAKFGGGNRLLAAFGIAGNVVLHACLDTAGAGLNARAGALNVRSTGFDHRDIIQQRLPAGLGELAEMLFDARLDPSGARLNPGAMLLDIRIAGFAHCRLLCDGLGRRSQKKGDQNKADYPLHS